MQSDAELPKQDYMKFFKPSKRRSDDEFISLGDLRVAQVFHGIQAEPEIAFFVVNDDEYRGDERLGYYSPDGSKHLCTVYSGLTTTTCHPVRGQQGHSLFTSGYNIVQPATVDDLWPSKRQDVMRNGSVADKEAFAQDPNPDTWMEDSYNVGVLVDPKNGILQSLEFAYRKKHGLPIPQLSVDLPPVKQGIQVFKASEFTTGEEKSR